MMICAASPARFSAAKMVRTCSAKADVGAVGMLFALAPSRENYAQAKARSKAGSQVPDCSCSDRAAGTAGSCSSSTQPHAKNSVLSVVARRLARTRLTPARFDARKLVVQRLGHCGSGVAVPSGTCVEPGWNHQHIENVALFTRFQWFRAVASRDARTGLCVCTCAYMCEGIAGTLEPLTYCYVNQWVIGSKAVPSGFQLEPLRCPALTNGSFLRFRNILAGGYGRDGLIHERDRRRSGLLRGRGRESFGDFGDAAVLGERFVQGGWVRVAGSGEAGGVASSGAGLNGGNPRFLECDQRHVGSVMLEGMAERRGFLPFPDAGRMPVRLARRAPGGRADARSRLAKAPRGVDRPGHPPMPPFAPRPAPRALARQTVRIWIGFAPAQHQGICTAGSGTRQSGGGWIGSGCGLSRANPAACKLGRGSIFAGNPRRMGQVIGRRAHVN